MPKSDYSFLSDTQLKYLKNPDQFNSQRSAEISYRIRGQMGGDYQDGVYRTFYTGFCSTCQQKAHEYAREHGTVPCSYLKHTAHRPDSNVFNECYEKGNIPLSDEDLRSIDEITTPEKVAETG